MASPRLAGASGPRRSDPRVPRTRPISVALPLPCRQPGTSIMLEIELGLDRPGAARTALMVLGAYLFACAIRGRTAAGRDPAAYRRLIMQSGSRWSGPCGKVDKLLYLSDLVLHQPVG